MPSKPYENTKNARYGSLVSTGDVVIKLSSSGYKVPYIICKCDCGTINAYNYYHLIAERIHSCGCSRKRPTNTFGASSKEIKILRGRYESIKSRCYNPKSKQYKSYGAIGIKMCQEWLDDFGAFVKWSLSSGFDKSLTIDRKDVSKDYRPDNCQWITNLEQQHNKRNTIYIYDNGIKRSLAEMCNERNFCYNRAYRRYAFSGLRSIDEIFSSDNYKFKKVVN